MKKRGLALYLFTKFFYFGCFTFGGGWGIVAQMEKEFVNKTRAITKEELLDMISVGRSLPGIMICNIAFLHGYHVGGAICGFVCVAGMALPPVLILMAVTICYSFLETQALVGKAMAGVRAAVVPIILSGTIRLWNGAFRFPACYAYMVVSFFLYYFLRLNPIVLVLFGAAAGILTCEYEERRQR